MAQIYFVNLKKSYEKDQFSSKNVQKDNDQKDEREILNPEPSLIVNEYYQ